MIAPQLAGNLLGSETSDFILAEWSDAGGPPGPPRWIAPLHIHHDDDEAWYVLEGSLCVRLGDEEVIANAGSAVLVPRGIKHTYWNPGPGPVRYLLCMTPNIYRLIQSIHALTERSPAIMAELFERHRSTLL
jgi:mannose-6-phosphate isomerase-like protein (cupin superfamily)